MSHAPESLEQLGRYWSRQGGRMLGIVGNTAHTVGYHLGRDRIYDAGGPGLGDQDYSVQRPRDKEGLTNAASAIDLGRIDGELRKLQRFSRWLVEQCLLKKPGTQDIREVIYSPDGQLVLRFSQPDDAIYTGPGNGDSGHRTHTHISYFRDSEDRDKVAVFRPYFDAPAPDATPFDQADVDAAIAAALGADHHAAEIAALTLRLEAIARLASET